MELARAIMSLPMPSGAEGAAVVRAAARHFLECMCDGLAVGDGERVVMVAEGGASDVMIGLALLLDDPCAGNLQLISAGPANRSLFTNCRFVYLEGCCPPGLSEIHTNEILLCLKQAAVFHLRPERESAA